MDGDQNLNDGNDSYFVDTFSEEYSRDIEMMKGGYGDNFVVQTLINTRKYKYSEAKHYEYDLKTMPLDNFTAEAWKDVKSEYKDPVGDALAATTATRFRPPLTWITATQRYFFRPHRARHGKSICAGGNCRSGHRL